MKPRSAYLSLFFFLAGLMLPAGAHAASLSFETLSGVPTVGDTVVVRAYLDSDTDTLNAIDGDISVSEGTAPLTITDISVVQSALSMWAKNPTVSADNTHVIFTGGTPGGMSQKHALLLTLIVKPTAAGTVTVTAQKAIAYKNDGKGTAVPVTVKPFSFTVAPHVAGTPARDQWKEVVGVDTTPPDTFTITLGSDPSVFDGKKFITYQTTDSQSGIDHYDVTEGNRGAVTTNAPYVLIEQSSPVTITVTAYDKAGNAQTATLTTGTSLPPYLPWVVALAVLVFIALSVILIATRKRTV